MAAQHPRKGRAMSTNIGVFTLGDAYSRTKLQIYRSPRQLQRRQQKKSSPIPRVSFCIPVQDVVGVFRWVWRGRGNEECRLLRHHF